MKLYIVRYIDSEEEYDFVGVIAENYDSAILAAKKELLETYGLDNMADLQTRDYEAFLYDEVGNYRIIVEVKND